MVIILNKNRSVQMVTPSTVYQGSNLADELTVFAPFSVKSYPAILVNFQLPSGEYLPRSVAFYAEPQPDGFGAWSMQLDSKVTSIPGTVKVSFTFISSYTGIDESTQPITITNPGPTANTATAEFTVTGDVKYIEPSDPPPDNIYREILQGLSAILNRNVNWDQNDSTSPAYILKKPPISAIKNNTGTADGAIVSGKLIVSGDITSNGVKFSDKLDKQTFSDNQHPNDIGVYAVSGANQFIQTATATSDASAGGCIALYGASGNLSTQEPKSDDDCANKQYVDELAAEFGEAVDEFERLVYALKLVYNPQNGHLSLEYYDGNTLGEPIDLPLESTVSNAYFDENNNDLVIEFTNGNTANIPVDALANPAWITNLKNIPSGGGSVPPTADAVKNYVDDTADTKLDKQVFEEGNDSRIGVYAVQKGTQQLLEAVVLFQIDNDTEKKRIPIYTRTGQLTINDPLIGYHAVPLGYLQENTAAAIRGNVSGPAIRVDDASDLNKYGEISTSPAVSALKKYTNNLLDATTAEAFSSGQVTGEVQGYSDGHVDWTAGTNYVKFPIYIPKGSLVSYSFSFSSSTETLGRVRFWGEVISGTSVYTSPTTGATKDTFIAGNDIYYMTIFKNDAAVAIPEGSSIVISDLVVTIGDSAVYSDYQAPEYVPLEEGKRRYYLADNPIFTPLWGETTEITATYIRDSTKVIDKLLSKIEALQNALAT